MTKRKRNILLFSLPLFLVVLLGCSLSTITTPNTSTPTVNTRDISTIVPNDLSLSKSSTTPVPKPTATPSGTPTETHIPTPITPFAGNPDERPYAIINGEISGNSVSLIATGTSPFDLALTYTWWQDATNPVPLEIASSTAPTTQVSIPTIPGEYYINLTASDTQGNSFTARRIITVDDQNVYINTVEQPAQWINHITLYEIEAFHWYPAEADRFFLAQQHLDKLVQMGVNTVWFTPIFDGIGLGYATTRYYQINPALGTEQSFKDFVQAAHQKGIKVILDLVLNHAGNTHPFIQDVFVHKSASPYADFFIWKGNPGDSQYEYYYTWKEAPNWNVANPKVRDYLFGIAEFWLINYDIDGYRADAAWGVEKRSNTFWKELTARLRNIKPEIFLLGEGPAYPEGGAFDANFSTKHDKSILFDERFTAVYDWRLRDWSEDGGLQGALGGLLSINQLDKILMYEYPPHGLPLRFIENHDLPRVTSLYDNQRSKLAHTLIFTVPGVPLIYGGAEFGQTEQFAGITRDKYGLLPYFSALINARKNYIDNYATLQRLPNNQAEQIYSYATLSKNSVAITVLNFGKNATVTKINLSPIANILPPHAQLMDIFADRQTSLGENLSAFPVALDPYDAKLYILPLNNP